MQNVQVRIRRPLNAAPTPDDFELIEQAIPELRTGEMLCRARWLALDPHVQLVLEDPGIAHRPHGARVVPARAVADVVQSRNDVFAAGTCVELENGLQEFSVCGGSHVHALRPAQNPASTALGLLGVPGMCAYFGLLDVARLQPRETVLVSPATSAVGAMAGQIAMLRGARAIGIDTTREKCDWTVRTARFSACIEHGREDLGQRLRALAPRGVDVYVEDTPGGETLRTLLHGSFLASNARIVVRTILASALKTVTTSGANILPIDVARYAQRRDEFLKDAAAWYGEGLLVHREDIVDGLHNAPAHLCKLLRGETCGETLVRV
jgi:NADPH-dependent curcumin reductase